MRRTLTRGLALGSLMWLAGCLNLGLEPSVGGVVSSVIVTGEALEEFAEVQPGSGSIFVTGQIVGRLRCDTVEGTVREDGDAFVVTITMISGRQGCNSLSPTTFSYAANLFNIDPGPTRVLVDYEYRGVNGQAGRRLETNVTVQSGQ